VASPSVSLLYAAAPPEPAYAMPDLTGLPLAEATSLITESGLKPASVTDVSNSPNGSNPFANPYPNPPEVIAQTPAPGVRVTSTTNISLQVTHSL
jgi:beta-lactam-binding protein with PASTA domain